MKRQILFVVLLIAFVSGPQVSAAERDIFYLGVALDQAGARGAWQRIGDEGKWKGVLGGVILNDRLYTAEKDGRLYVSNLESGERKAIGRVEFGDTLFVFGAGDHLYSIEKNGCLYRVSPRDGTWVQVGEDNAFEAVKAGAVCNGRLYTVEMDGSLHAADLGNGKRTQVGKAEFKDIRALFSAGDKLACVNKDGNLLRVDPANGTLTRVGPEAGWKGTRFASVLRDQVYAIEGDGTLRSAAMADGKRKQLGKAEFGETAFLFAGGKEIYTIENDGSLYVVNVIPRESLGAFDCYPREFEQAFRQQGKDHYRNFTTQMVLGERATRAGILKGLAWLREKATANDLVVMYLTCHGGLDPEQGWGVETADNESLWGHEIKAELAKLPCGVVFFLETCHSGGFAHAHKKDPAVPANVTVICACSGKQEVGNQLDIAALEGLYGRADFDKDGVVTVDELIRYVELRYQELWPEAEKPPDHLRPVIVKSKTMPGSMPLTKPSSQLAAIFHKGDIWSAVVEKQEGEDYHVHVLGWDPQPGMYFLTNKVTRDCICLPNEGPPLLVEQNHTWYPARMLSKQGEKYKVHYLGYQEEEVVTRERIKYPFVGKGGGK
jgi:hypothetical protein